MAVAFGATPPCVAWPHPERIVGRIRPGDLGPDFVTLSFMPIVMGVVIRGSRFLGRLRSPNRKRTYVRLT